MRYIPHLDVAVQSVLMFIHEAENQATLHSHKHGQSRREIRGASVEGSKRENKRDTYYKKA